MTFRPEDLILAEYDRALTAHGDTAEGALWPNQTDRLARFDVMLDVLDGAQTAPLVLCDLACGTGELLAHLRRRGLGHVSYRGIDRSDLALAYARRKFPGVPFVAADVTAPGADLRPLECDYLVASGLFTRKAGLTFDEMWAFMETTLKRAWPHVRRGLAFNVMSTAVDWEREDLFHVPMDRLARLLHDMAGRRVRMRADYGLYEYTAYAFKPDPADPAARLRSEARADSDFVPVLRPALPAADRLTPYLQRIDRSRIYTNFGPLNAALEARLARRFGLERGNVTTASSGSAALIGAILACAGRAKTARPVALIPAYTFVATAAAVEQAGYQPTLVDVSDRTWTLDPDALLAHPDLTHAGLVVPVAAYGRSVDLRPWVAFQERTGIAVVVDGAAAFDTLVREPARYVGPIPVTLSFHATKSFSTGEGGAVASTDAGVIERVVQALNFGFAGSRDCASASLNGRMSEFHAAVGLAELDDWDEKAAAWQRVATAYRRAFSEVGLADRIVALPEISAAYALARCLDPAEAVSVERALARRHIDFRYWYGGGVHRHSYYQSAPRRPLDVTDRLASCLIGLPVAPDLSEADIQRAAAAVAEAVGGQP
jgi:dTDP-4-amino-4,6-dideoxygalactose transaminase